MEPATSTTPVAPNAPNPVPTQSAAALLQDTPATCPTVDAGEATVRGAVAVSAAAATTAAAASAVAAAPAVVAAPAIAAAAAAPAAAAAASSTSAPSCSAPSSIPSAPAADGTDSEIDFERRFGGVARLYGAPALAGFRAARVCVIGVGGVGSWIVEALARSAVGHITMIDLDNLSESNVNRQIHALSDTLGMAKVEALAQRIAQINPFCRVQCVEEFITEDNVVAMVGGGQFDHIIDAIDDVRAKVALIAYCRAQGMSLTTIGGAGGQTDPTKIEVRDLCRTEQEPLLARVRKRLRALHQFPRGTRNKFHIDAVFSTEPLAMPGQGGGNAASVPQAGDDAATAPQAGDVAASASGFTGLNCAGYGSSVAVTASFGFVAAAHVLRKIADAANAVPVNLVTPASTTA